MEDENFDFVALIKARGAEDGRVVASYTLWHKGKEYQSWQQDYEDSKVSTAEWIAACELLEHAPWFGQMLVLTNNEILVKVIRGKYKAKVNLEEIKRLRRLIERRPHLTVFDLNIKDIPSKKKSPEFEPDYIAYTDGGYVIAKSLGAAACVIIHPETKEVLYTWSRACGKSTNNRQELGAIIKAISVTPVGAKLEIRSDSDYSIGILSGRDRAHLNTDLLELYKKTLGERRIRVKFKWVKGHNGNQFNEMADTICTDAMERYENGGVRELESRGIAFL